MKKMRRLSIVCILAAAIVLSGCSKNGGSDSGNASANPSNSAGESSAAPGAPVKIKVFAVNDSTDTKQLETNTFTKQVESMFNIKFEWMIAPSDGAAEKRKLALASGDYPDMFLLVPSVDSFKQEELLLLGEQGVIVPLNDLIDRYGPNIKETLEANPDYKAMNTASDGKIYGLNGLSACYHCSFPNKLWVNSSWLKKLNIPVPRTTDDFKAMLQAFKKQDPNGNKKEDEIPLSGSMEIYGVHVVPFLMNAFIYDDDRTYLLLNEEGKVDFAPTKAEWRQGLQYIKSLYNEELIDPGAFTQNSQAYSKIGENDPQILGAGAGMHPAIFVNVGEGNKYSKDYDSIPPIAGPDGKAYATYNYTGNPGASFVLTNKAGKEAQITAIKMLDYIYTFDGQMAAQSGVEGQDWRKPQGDEKALDDSMEPRWFVISQPADSKPHNSTWNALGQYNLSKEFRGSQVQGEDIYDITGYERRLYDATKHNYEGRQPAKVFPHWAVWIDPSSADQVSMMRTNITNYVEENQLQFITGHKSLDKDWDSYVKGFDSMQLDHYLELMQNAYDSSIFSN